MQRFVSERSSLSVDLASSSLDDVRAEPVAISVSVGLSWPPVKRQQFTGHPCRQQLWERGLQEHILHHHGLLHFVRCKRPGWWPPGKRGGRPHQHSLFRPNRPNRSLTTGPAAAVRCAVKSTSTPSLAAGSSKCLASGGQSGDGTCSGACARSGACAQGCSTGTTQTLPTVGNGARHEQHRSAERLCCHLQTWLGSVSTSCE